MTESRPLPRDLLVFSISIFQLHKRGNIACFFCSYILHVYTAWMCESHEYMLSTVLKRRPGAALEVQTVCLAPGLSPWENQIQNAAQTTNYCTVLDKVTCTFPFCQTPEKEDCKTEKKRIMSFLLSIEHVLKGPLTKRRWKSGVSWLALAFSFVTMLTFSQIAVFLYCAGLPNTSLIKYS